MSENVKGSEMLRRILAHGLGPEKRVRRWVNCGGVDCVESDSGVPLHFALAEAAYSMR